MQDFAGYSLECDDRAMDSAESIAWKSKKVTGNLCAKHGDVANEGPLPCDEARP
jgi:hypothetical protein